MMIIKTSSPPPKKKKKKKKMSNIQSDAGKGICTSTSVHWSLRMYLYINVVRLFVKEVNACVGSTAA